jgi:GntR family transcriptional repressor for pyruvate dehydrogenase complex
MSKSSRLTARSRRLGLVDLVVSGMRQLIDEQSLQVGDKLPTEGDLIARFQVSRTVVRESMSRLQAAGLIKTQHGIGSFVLGGREDGNSHLIQELSIARQQISELFARVEQLEKRLKT